MILIKNGFLEFKKALHPNAVLPLRYNHSVVKKEVIVNILAFFMLYLINLAYRFFRGVDGIGGGDFKLMAKSDARILQIITLLIFRHEIRNLEYTKL